MSTRVLRNKPEIRKRPRQARSRATVETIVEAAARVLGDEGWAGFTANKVADRAGFGIGSLYQYFPNKIALVEAVRERHLDDCLRAIERCLVNQRGAEDLARCLVEGLIQVHTKHPKLHKTLIDEAPISEELADPLSAFEEKYLGVVAECVAQQDGEPVSEGHLATARLLSDAMDGAIHNAARRGQLHEAVLARELTRLVGSYLLARKRAPET